MLEGIKVIEMATYIAAPGAGAIMADWGAQVIKVEPLQGCPMRLFFANLGADDLKGNPVFDLDNRGKRSVALNTATREGVEALKKMVTEADVFLTNVRPGGLERAGLDYESLKKVNPGLVYASVSGYGLQGPERDRPGFDAAAFHARSGIGALTTPRGQEPAPLRTAVGDHTTSMATAAGILAALLERHKTGRGRLVEASLMRTGIYTLGSDMAIQLKFGRLASSKSRQEAVNPLANYFLTRDDIWITIIPRQGNRDWLALCKAVGRPDLPEEEKFSTGRLRRTHGAELVTLLDAAFRGHDLDHWSRALDAQDIVWAPMMPPRDVVNDPQAQAAGAFVQVPENDGSGFYPAPATPIRFGGEGPDAAPRGPSPDLGQHTREVLREIGYTQEELHALQASGAIQDTA